MDGRENIPPGVCLFAANHTSNADAPAIVGAIPRRIAILGRKSLFDIPVVGTAFRLAKFVPVDRENRDAALASVKQAVEYIREGFSFLVYPEGTRSPDGRLHRFKKGSFAIAIEAGIPIVPVACAGAHRIMKKNSLIIRPGKVTVRFGKPIDASAYTVEQRDELAQRVHDAVAAELPEDQKPATCGTGFSLSGFCSVAKIHRLKPVPLALLVVSSCPILRKAGARSSEFRAGA